MYIDVHGHLAPLGERGGGPPSLRDPEGSIAAKRALGIEMTIIGAPVGAGSMLPGSGVDNYAQTADQVRAHNEAMGELVSRFPDALRAYAYLDPFGDERMLGQAVDLLADWRFVGLIVNSSVNGVFLGSPRATDFFAMAAESGVPVLLHPPAEPVGTSAIGHLGLIEHVARPCDVTLGVAAIVAAGWLARYPDLRLIAAAGGGGLAHLAEKLDLAMAPTPGRPGTAAPAVEVPALAARPSDSLRRMYVEMSCPSATQLIANLREFGAGRVLFGTDAPPLMDAAKRIVDILTAVVVDERERALIADGNARRLFGLVTEEASSAAGVA